MMNSALAKQPIIFSHLRYLVEMHENSLDKEKQLVSIQQVGNVVVSQEEKMRNGAKTKYVAYEIGSQLAIEKNKPQHVMEASGNIDR